MPEPFAGDQVGLNSTKKFAMKWDKVKLQFSSELTNDILIAVPVKKVNRSGGDQADRFVVISSNTIFVRPPVLRYDNTGFLS